MNMLDSIISKKKHFLCEYIPEPTYVLDEIYPRDEYVDGEPIGHDLGFNYVATNIETYEQITVYVKGTNPVIQPNKFLELKEQGLRVYVQFSAAVIYPYFSENTQTIVDLIDAESVQIVEPK